MTASLPLPIDLPRVFTPASARASGIARPALERMLRHGVVRRVRRGVLAPADVPDSPSVRAAALALLVRPDRVVVGRTAAWLHGMPAGGGDVLEVAPRGSPALVARDVQRWGEVVVTTPVRTAADLARAFPRERALSVLDAYLRGGVELTELLEEVGRHAGLKGAGRLRELAALADPRARDPGESVLRLRWLDAGLPTPVAGLVVSGCRLALGLPERQFGVTLESSGAPAGWRVLPLSRLRVLGADPALLEGHLRCSFHQALLEEVG